jgi:hypothetical protein
MGCDLGEQISRGIFADGSGENALGVIGIGVLLIPPVFLGGTWGQSRRPRRVKRLRDGLGIREGPGFHHATRDSHQPQDTVQRHARLTSHSEAVLDSFDLLPSRTPCFYLARFSTTLFVGIERQNQNSGPFNARQGESLASLSTEDIRRLDNGLFGESVQLFAAKFQGHASLGDGTQEWLEEPLSPPLVKGSSGQITDIVGALTNKKNQAGSHHEGTPRSLSSPTL